MLLGAAIAAVSVATAALVYSTNLAGLVSQPPRYGWTYDVGAVINAGFDGANPAAIETSLDRPEVAGWGVATTALSATIDGVKLPAIADVRGLADLGMPTLEGVLPRHDHEVALGSVSAERLSKSVGDQVNVQTDYGGGTATVTGIVVLPSIGTFLSDRPGLGTGILLSAPFFQGIVGPTGFYDRIGGFVAVDVRDGLDGRDLMSAVGEEALTWDHDHRPPAVHVDPVRPTQIADLASVERAPLLLAGMIALTMIIGLVAALGRAVRVRRRELAVMRALGCRGSQLFASLCWQAVTVVVIGLVAGVPLGTVLGSALWRGFASGLGILPAATQPWAWVGGLVVAALAVAVVAALRPGRWAAAAVPAIALREP